MPKLALKVIEAKLETPTIKSVKLGLEGNAFSFKPGQYCLFYVTLPEGKQVSHSFSIASSPTRSDYVQFATRQSESEFKKGFWALKEGDGVTVNGPFGDFVYDESIDHAVMLSGGIGITPLKSMLEYAADKKIGKKITLLFSNRSSEEIPFKQDLDETAAQNQSIEVVYTVSNLQPGEQWTGKTGRVNDAMVKEFAPDWSDCTFFICGPPGMVDGLTQMLAQMSVAGERLRVEHFTGYK